MNSNTRQALLPLGAGLIAAAAGTIGYGFLGMAGVPQINWAFVPCVKALVYTVDYGVASRHYR